MSGSIATEVIPRVIDKRFDHLTAMSDRVGLFEHARYDQPRAEHGYCVDDVARGLVVLMRESDLDERRRALTLPSCSRRRRRTDSSTIDERLTAPGRMSPDQGTGGDVPSGGWRRSRPGQTTRLRARVSAGP